MPNTREMMKKDAKKKKKQESVLDGHPAGVKLAIRSQSFNPGGVALGQINETREKFNKIRNKEKKGEKASAEEILDLVTDMFPGIRGIKEAAKTAKDLIDGKNPIDRVAESFANFADDFNQAIGLADEKKDKDLARRNAIRRRQANQGR